MASRKHSKASSSFWNLLPKVLNGALLLCVLFNFLALAWSVRSTAPRQVHTLETITTNHFFTVTQRVEVATSSSVPVRGDGLSSVSVESVGFEISQPYHYMVIDGVPMIRFFGRTFKAGDDTSYGRIVDIFPDRVRLEGNTYLKNTNNPDGVRSTP